MNGVPDKIREIMERCDAGGATVDVDVTVEEDEDMLFSALH